MDKGKNVQAIISAVMVLMLLFAGQTSATPFELCFPGCAISGCLFSGHKIICAFKCLAKCLLGGGLSKNAYCKLGCAVDQCAHLVDDFKFEDVGKIVSCVGECEFGNQCNSSQAIASLSSQELSPKRAPSPNYLNF